MEKTTWIDRYCGMRDMLPLRVTRYVDTWAVWLSPLLTGKVLDVYLKLSSEDARDFEKLRKALLQRYDSTEQGYYERFRNA